MNTKNYNSIFLGKSSIKTAFLSSEEEKLTIVDSENNIFQYNLCLSVKSEAKITLQINSGPKIEVFNGSNSICKSIFDDLAKANVRKNNNKKTAKQFLSVAAVLTIIFGIGLFSAHKHHHYHSNNTNYNFNETQNFNNWGMKNNNYMSYQPQTNYQNSHCMGNQTETCNIDPQNNLNNLNQESLLPPSTQEIKESIQGSSMPANTYSNTEESKINLNIQDYSVAKQLETITTDENQNTEVIIENNENTMLDSNELPQIKPIETDSKDNQSAQVIKPIIIENEQEILSLNILVRDLIDRGELIPIELANQLDEELRTLLEEGDLISKESDTFVSGKAALQNLYKIRNKDQDQYGIPKLPEPNSLFTLSQSVKTPFPGGGDAENPEEFKSFGLYIEEDKEE